MAAQVIFGSAFEGSTATLLARITGVDGTPINQASVEEVAYEGWKIPTPLEYRATRDWKSLYVATDVPSRFFAARTPTVAAVIFNSLQTDDRWTKDLIGYNFAIDLPDDTFDEIPVGSHPRGQWYELPVQITPVDDGPLFFFSYKVLAKHVLFGKA